MFSNDEPTFDKYLDKEKKSIPKSTCKEIYSNSEPLYDIYKIESSHCRDEGSYRTNLLKEGESR